MSQLRVCRVPATGSRKLCSPDRWLRRAMVAGLVALWCPIASATSLSPWAGPSPPPFTLSRLDRSPASLGEVRDATVVVHFFATWCEPCRAELVALDAFARARPAEQLRILVISVGEPETRVRRFFANLPVAFPVLLDPESATARAWGVSAFPTTFVLAPGLAPALKAEGELDWSAAAIRDALARLTPKPQTR